MGASRSNLGYIWKCLAVLIAIHLLGIPSHCYVKDRIINVDDFPNSVIELVGMMFGKDLLTDRHLFASYYSPLNTTIEALDKNLKEYNEICTYVANTHGPTHNFKLSVRNIFSIKRHGAYSKFKPYKALGNRKLLWHGSRLVNQPSILQHGLLVDPPTNVSINGKMFGNGVYFADVATKAAQYCGANTASPYGILILAEVALGELYYKTKSKNIVELPKGKNSVKGLGKYKPDKTKTIYTKYGAQIPLGTLEYQNDLVTDLIYCEYCVYNSDQILIQYLVLVDFEYPGC